MKIANLFRNFRVVGPPSSLLWRLLPPLAAVLFLMIIGAGALLWEQHLTNAKARAANLDADILSDFQGLLDSEASGMSQTSLSMAADPRVQNALLDRDSDRLLADWGSVFKTLQRENNLTHFNFLDKNRILILRIQKPEEQGDLIKRFTAIKAESTGKAAWGIEIGQVGTLVLRVVQPVFQDGKLLGYVELGKEIDRILQRLHTRRGSQLAAVVKKKYLGRPQWEERMNSLGREPDWNRLAQNVIIYASQGSLPDSFVPLADLDPAAGHIQASTDREISLDGKLWRISVMPLQEASGTVVGNLLAMADITADKIAFHRTLLLGSLVSGVLLVLLLGFLYVLLRRTDASVRSESKKLLESEQRYRKIFNSVSEGIFQIGLDGRCRIINPAFARMFGYKSPEEMMAAETRISDRIWLRPENWTGLIELLKASTMKDFEGRLARKDGSILWVSINAIAVEGTEEDLPYIEGTCMDITERKLRGEELARKTNLLTGLLNSIPDVVFFKDLEGVYLGCNPEFARYAGMTQHEIVGRTDYDLFSCEVAESYRENDRLMMESGEPRHNEEWIDYPDGRRSLLDTFKAPLRSADGLIIGIIGVSRDVTEPKTVEQRLRESEENFRIFFETMDDIIVVGTPEGRIKYANPAVYHKLGYTVEELAAKHVLDLHPKELRLEAEKIFAAMFRGERESCPLPLQSKSGFLVQVETRVWFGKWSGVDCIFGICKDLSREQEALQKFDKFFHNNPAPMGVSTLPERRFSDVNDSFLDTLGFSREEVIGRTASELGIFFQPEKQKEVEEGIAASGRVSDIQLKVRRKDGAILEGLFSGEVIESQGQKMFVTVMIDITKRKKAEEGLRQREAYLRAILNNAPFLMWLKDKEGKFLAVNDVFAKSCGEQSADNLTGKTDHDVWPRELAERCRADDLEVMNEKIQMHVEEPISGRGDIRWFETLKTPIVDDEGEIIGTTGFSRDVTDRKRTQELLLQADRQRVLVDLAGGVAHNFNNLLQIIISRLELALIDLEGGDYSKVKKMLVAVLDSSKLGCETVRRLQSIAGIRDHSQFSEKAIFDLSGILEQAAEMSKTWWKSIPEKQGIAISMGMELQKGCFVQCGENELFEVLVNLIKNSAEALPMGGAIRVSTRIEGERVMLTIEDTGVGMSEETLKRLFIPFFTTKANAGSGLGLASSRRIIEDCGGEILVKSAVGQGTTVTIILPLAQLSCEQPEISDQVSGGQLNILVIDDAEAVSDALQIGLTIFGHTVHTASSGQQGLEFFQENPVDLVICDLGMPGMNGWEVGKKTKSICEQRQVPKTPFILLTGWGGQKTEVEKIAESGVDVVVEKPINLEKILKIIQASQ